MKKASIHDCGGCSVDDVSNECMGAFSKIGIAKVHWECWSECNLPCAFCYRMRGAPLNTSDALRLLKIIRTSGARTVVFAGGDPSLREDLLTLVRESRALQLGVEVQTNGHFQPQYLRDALCQSDLVGVSLDGSSAEVHDSFRGRQGNFQRVVGLLEFLSERGIPVAVRSLIAASNHGSIPELATILRPFANIVRWSLLEFTEIGDGFKNSETYRLDRHTFNETALQAQQVADGKIPVDVYRNENKTGTYALVTPDGKLYGTSRVVDGDYLKVSSMLEVHLWELANGLSFDQEKHQQRYGGLPPMPKS